MFVHFIAFVIVGKFGDLHPMEGGGYPTVELRFSCVSFSQCGCACRGQAQMDAHGLGGSCRFSGGRHKWMTPYHL